MDNSRRLDVFLLFLSFFFNLFSFLFCFFFFSLLSFFLFFCYSWRVILFLLLFVVLVLAIRFLVVVLVVLDILIVLLVSYISSHLVNSVRWSHALVNGPTSKNPPSDGGRCSVQLLMMWSAVALSGSPHFFIDALYQPTPVRSLFRVVKEYIVVTLYILWSRPVFSAQIFSLDALSWVRYVAMHSGGTGCFPLLFPRCRNGT